MRRLPSTTAFILPPTLVAAASLAASAPAATAQDLHDSPFLPASVVIRDERVAVYRGPDKQGGRRGTAIGGHHLPVYRFAEGPGCRSWWAEVYWDGWICGDILVPSALPPDAPALPELPEGQLTPYPLAFAREGGAPLYQRLSDAAIDYAERWLDEGYAISVRRRTVHEGQRYYGSAGGLWARSSDLYLARPSAFQGTELDGPEAVGWTYRQTTRVYERLPTGGGGRSRTLRQQALLRFTAEHEVGRTVYLQTTDDEFVRAADVRRPEYLDPPEGIGPYDVWFDVDRAQQLLTVSEGARPIYATLISSGRQGHTTPEGEFRIWTKLITDRMANEEPDDPEEKPYFLEDVPWVMYFNRDIALHGAYWHRSFGHVRSHGCVNLAPLDARWVFDRAQPALPRGWWAILPNDEDPGSVVRVR